MVLLPPALRTWQRIALVAHAALLPLVLVRSGEHYVVDTLLGAAYACGGVLLLPPAGRLVRAGGRRAALPWRA